MKKKPKKIRSWESNPEVAVLKFRKINHKEKP